jgi:hypothetical protein
MTKLDLYSENLVCRKRRANFFLVRQEIELFERKFLALKKSVVKYQSQIHRKRHLTKAAETMRFFLIRKIPHTVGLSDLYFLNVSLG